LLFFFSRTRPPLTPTLFPYTTLFRSHAQERVGVSQAGGGERVLGVELEGGAERLERVPDGDPPLIEEPTAFEVEVVGFEIFRVRSEEHTSELQSRGHLVCRLLLEKKK